MRANLVSMVQLSRNSGADVLLLGMRMPPNYGERYTTGFQDMYSTLAQAHKLPLVPFLLDGIALNAALMQADQIHPNELGQPKLLANVWAVLKPLLHH